jgi:uncharacterized protein (TIGR02246 family)
LLLSLLAITLLGVFMVSRQTQSSATAPDDDIDAIRQLTETWLDAVKTKDVNRLLTLVTEDVVFLPPGRPPIKGKEAVHDLYQLLFGQFNVVQSAKNEEIQILGDWAFAWGSESLILTPRSGGPAVEMAGKGLTVLRRLADGSWRYARGINNSLPQQASEKH